MTASFGIASFSQALCDAVADVTASGVLVVAAAGNSDADNDATHPSPAACDAPGDLAVAHSPRELVPLAEVAEAARIYAAAALELCR